MEFLDYMGKLDFGMRPHFLLIECVASLAKNRKLTAATEKGTTIVSQKLREFGFLSSWKVLNSRHFGIPQSRTRTYGIFVKMKHGLGSCGEKKHESQLSQIWSLSARCQMGAELLRDLLKRSDLESCQLPDGPGKKPSTQPPGQKKPGKWVDERKVFRKNHGLENDPLDWHPALKALKRDGPLLNLSSREQEASLLLLAKLLKEKPGMQTSCLVLPVGDSLSRMKYSSAWHPCLLPQKKFLYILDNRCYTTGKSSKLPFTLQGLELKELELAGPAVLKLTPQKAQELAGNAFTSNVVLTLLLGVLVHFHS